MNYGQLRNILKVAADDGVKTYHGVDYPEDLSPEKYDGDGESFHFSLSEGLLGEIAEEDEDIAKEAYLAGFWNKIEELLDKGEV